MLQIDLPDLLALPISSKLPSRFQGVRVVTPTHGKGKRHQELQWLVRIVMRGHIRAVTVLGGDCTLKPKAQTVLILPDSEHPSARMGHSTSSGSVKGEHYLEVSSQAKIKTV